MLQLLLALALAAGLLVQPAVQQSGQIIWQPRLYEPAQRSGKSISAVSVQAAKVYGPAVEVSPSVIGGGWQERAFDAACVAGRIYIALELAFTRPRREKQRRR